MAHKHYYECDRCKKTTTFDDAKMWQRLIRLPIDSMAGEDMIGQHDLCPKCVSQLVSVFIATNPNYDHIPGSY